MADSTPASEMAARQIAGARARIAEQIASGQQPVMQVTPCQHGNHACPVCDAEWAAVPVPALSAEPGRDQWGRLADAESGALYRPATESEWRASAGGPGGRGTFWGPYGRLVYVTGGPQSQPEAEEPSHCPTCHQDWAHCLCYPRHPGS
jgi:hypothetical protein